MPHPASLGYSYSVTPAGVAYEQRLTKDIAVAAAVVGFLQYKYGLIPFGVSSQGGRLAFAVFTGLGIGGPLSLLYNLRTLQNTDPKLFAFAFTESGMAYSENSVDVRAAAMLLAPFAVGTLAVKYLVPAQLDLVKAVVFLAIEGGAGKLIADRLKSKLVGAVGTIAILAGALTVSV